MKDKRQELRNNFDDAYLALLMDELCEEEGALLWEECEQLNADPEAVVPESLHKKCVDIIEHHYAQERRRQRRGKSRAVIRKILIAAAVLMVLFTTAFATIDEFRVGVLNFSLKMKEKYSILVFADEDNLNTQEEINTNIVSEDMQWFGNNQIAVRFNLDEFEVLEDSSYKSGVDVFLKAEKTGQIIAIHSTKIVNEMGFQVDTEAADSVLDVQIGDRPGYMIVKNSRNHIIWIDELNGVMLEVVTSGWSEEDTIRLAESITYMKKD